MSTIKGCYCRTHIGKVRSQNEDAFLLEAWPDRQGVLAVIADGMGSYGGGAIAAKTVIETFAELLQVPFPESRDERYELLLSAFYRADHSIRRLQCASNPDMGATAIAVIATPQEILHLHAGDCRLYHLSTDRPAYISHDHSIVQSLIDSGFLQESDAGAHPMRSIVTSCLGGPSGNLRLTIDPHLEIDCTGGTMTEDDSPFRPLRSGDIVVICTDGLWSEIGSAAILDTAERNQSDGLGSEHLTDMLLDLALSGPATDNITVIALDADCRTLEYPSLESVSRRGDAHRFSASGEQ